MYFDGHGDILTDVQNKLAKGIDIWEDYHALKYFNADVQGAIFVNFTDPKAKDQKQQFAAISSSALNYFQQREDVQIVLNKTDLKSNKFKLIFGAEGIAPVADIAGLEHLYNLGYRHFGLTWNEANQFASGASETGGLTKLGQEAIKFANQKGMIVDFAHLNYESFMEASTVTCAPIMFSHGNVHSLCAHPRNLRDEQLQVIKDSNGVIGICAIPSFLRKDNKHASIVDVVEHIMYVRNLIGIDHVGLGFDFCYYLDDYVSEGSVIGLQTLDDVYKIKDLLAKRGLSKLEIDKVCFNNFIRVISDHLHA